MKFGTAVQFIINFSDITFQVKTAVLKIFHV